MNAMNKIRKEEKENQQKKGKKLLVIRKREAKKLKIS
jgi:hypothetical protein